MTNIKHSEYIFLP